MKKLDLLMACLAISAVVFNGCKKENLDYDSPNQGTVDLLKQRSNNSVGAVYAMDNAVGGNNILVYSRAADGTLTSVGSVPTGGSGTGSGLGSQGALALNADNSYLYACNAGSNDVTVFSVNGTSLTWVDKIASGGEQPISVTSFGNLLYVLNAGGAGNISGFTVAANGTLSHLVGSDQPLSASGVGPAQIEFNQAGTQLVVTEKTTNIIDTYSIGANGLPGTVVTHPSVGTTPFGFEFGKNNQLIVSDAFGGNPGASAMTSYALSNSGSLNLITGPVATLQTAACWVAVTNDGRYCYTTNTGSASITGYSISNSGALSLLDANGITGMTGGSPIDMSFSRNSKFLYALNSSGHSISMFHVNPDGSLTSLGDVTGLFPGSSGLAAQ